MNACTARAIREENWRTVVVGEIPGFFTQAKRFDQIPNVVRDTLTPLPEVETNPDQAQIDVIPDPTCAGKAAMVIKL